MNRIIAIALRWKSIGYGFLLCCTIGRLTPLSAKRATINLNAARSEIVHIRADKQALDLDRHALIFSENVHLEHPQFSLTGAELTCFPAAPGEKRLSAFSVVATGNGQPVQFTIALENGQATGSAKQIRYCSASQIVYMSESIELHYDGHTLRAEQLEYHIRKKRMIATTQNQHPPELTLRSERKPSSRVS